MKRKTFRILFVAMLVFAQAVFGAGYATDVSTIGEAQAAALDQAKEMLGQTENPRMKQALQKAIQEMERAQMILADAKKKPDALSAAVAAEQAAYQDILKTIPHESTVSRSRGKGKGAGAGQPNSREIDQLELTKQEDRYETERQATAQNPQQREQLRIADKLKQLAQRQQDLNDRLKELQTALAEAKTDQEKQDIQRQLKRLSDEEKQMLADVDELKQSVDQSPSADSMTKERQQLEQARSDTQRASQELQDQSVSQALAAGARAQEGLRNLQNDLQKQASSQFTQQMRQMRTQARDMAAKEDEIGKKLESLDNPERKSLDDSAQRQDLAQKMAQQESALTNLLGNMQTVSEQAESAEPLLSQQLYDTLRRASQMHNDNLLRASEQLIDHGLVNQAGSAEQAVRKNLNELRQSVERAAESVLGNESDALKYAQKELDELTEQVAKEGSSAGTNAAAGGQAGKGSKGMSNRTSEKGGAKPGAGDGKANDEAANSQGQKGEGTEGQGQDERADSKSQGGNQQGEAQGQRKEQANAQGQGSGQRGERGNQSGNGQGKGQGERAKQGNGQGQGEGEQANAGGQGGEGDRLRAAAEQFGGSANGGGARGGIRGLGNNGPITGTDFVDWSDRMRDVEQVIDSPELRNKLATARERVAAYRADFRKLRRKPDGTAVQSLVVEPMAEVRARLAEDIARLANAKSLVPLDHDPVPENYTEMVRKYYEKLGGGQ
jgi:hypothetical protein